MPASVGAISCTARRRSSATADASDSALPGSATANSSPPVPAGDSTRRQTPGENVPDLTHRLGAGKMPIGVVDRLQPIHVEYEHGERSARFARGPDHLAQSRLERSEVVQTCQVVGRGKAVQDSHLGTGSTFTVWLPVAPAAIAEGTGHRRDDSHAERAEHAETN